MKINIKLIKQKMKEYGWNQTKFANKLGVTRQSVSIQLKNGITSFNTIEKFAKVLNVKPKDLIL